MISDGIGKLYSKMETWIESFIKMLPNFIIAFVVLLIFIKLSKWAYRSTSNGLKKSPFNESLNHLVANIIRILVICAGIVVALGILELQKTVFSLLAGVGVIGLALGFAFQDLASNFISGIMIAVRAPLKIGDVVELSGEQGTVIDIKLRDTVIRNFDGQDIIIPNKEFTSNKFKNYSSFGMRKIKIEVGISYDDNPKEALKVLESALNKVEGILQDPAPEAYIESLAASSVNLFGHIWFTYPGGNYFQLRSDAIQLVKEELEQSGFSIPFPIRTLDIPEETLSKFTKSSR